MRVKKISELCMWLPGFAPEDDPLVSLGPIRAPTVSAEVIAFPGMHVPHHADVDVVAETPKVVWPQLTADALGAWGGKVSKYDANIKAINLLKQLEAENRVPDDGERLVLQRYTGWGGLPAAFNNDQKDPAWASRSDDLKKMLTADEWESARNSTPNAHFTDLPVVDAVWKAVQHLGFTGGRILEPSVGSGLFLGAMPKEIAEQSSVTTVELDDLSGRLVRKLYGHFGVQTLIQGFEKAKLPEGYFDLAIGNVPFGAYKVGDCRHKPYADWNIHNYFFGRTMDLVRAGGIIAFITSTSTMDRDYQDRQRDIRTHLNLHAEFLGAIRLPSGTFEAIAETSVTTDIIFLKKRAVKKVEIDAPWLNTKKATSAMRQDTLHFKDMLINEYFVSKPEMMIGKLDWVSNGYTAENVGLKYQGQSFESDLQNAIFHLPEGVFKPRIKVEKKIAETVRVPSAEYVKPGAYVIQGDRIMVSEGNMLRDIHDELKATARSRIEGLIEIRDAARRLLAAQVSSDDDMMLKCYQVALNGSYDAFVTRHGFVSLRANALVFRTDPDWPLLLSLEVYDEESGTAQKADLFKMRTVRKPVMPTKADSVEEGLAMSLQQFGGINMAFIAGLLGKREAETLKELSEKEAIFKNPETDEWETADHYLSGSVRVKLDIARVAGDDFLRNVKALEAVQPVDLKADEIEARLGAPWIPASDLRDFCEEVLTKCDKLEFMADNGTWNVAYNQWEAGRNVACSNTYGTTRANGMVLFEQALNQQVPTIRDKTIDDKYVVNPAQTLAAREKQAQIKEKFKDWIWEDDARRERLARKYNDEFNGIRLRTFDGSHLRLPGFTESITLRKHQLDAVWRIVASGNTLLAHAVGAGKTLEMVCASMELRRLGLANKVLHVVPNHMLEQYTGEFIRAYPTAHVLMASKDDLVGDKRRELVSRIATGNWDAVIMTHSTFERIRMSKEFMEDFIAEQLAELESAYMAARHDRDNRIVKDMARAKKTWEARLDKLQNEFKKDDLLNFEELGIDQIMVDEAHLFKNLFRISKMARVAGLPNSNSERAFDLYVKTRYLMALNKAQRGVVFATGTPISNSMAELFVMQRYLQPDVLKQHLVDNFDSWAASFGEVVTALEVSPDGGGYRLNARFARFINLPELLAMFGQVADIRTQAMLDLPLPKIVGGKPKTIAVPASQTLKDYVATLVARAERIKGGLVKPHEDNMLAVTNDGRKAALDLRLMDPLAEDDPESKVNACCQNVFDIWERTASFRGTQLVFCDLSTPGADGRFSVYQDLKAKWIAKGIPAHEVEFIHDHETDTQKAKLFKAVREGKVRILLGSTQKMGMGTNVQTRLYALHHLDCPWRSSDVEQRDGRIERQGNTNAEIEIYRYVTRGSFDAYSWQTVETKARFIAQVMTGSLGARSIEDVELAALSYAEVKALASGNPLVLEKAGIDAEVAKLSVLKSMWRSQQWSVKTEVNRLPKEIEIAKKRIAGLEIDEQKVVSARGKGFAMVLAGKRYLDAESAGGAMLKLALDALREGKSKATQTVVGEFGGFKLGIYMNQFRDFPNYYLDGETVEHHGRSMKSAAGMIDAIQDAFQSIPTRLVNAEANLATDERRLAGLLPKMDESFEQEDRLNEALQRQHQIDMELGLHQDNAGAIDAEAERLAA